MRLCYLFFLSKNYYYPTSILILIIAIAIDLFTYQDLLFYNELESDDEQLVEGWGTGMLECKEGSELIMNAVGL